MNLTLRFGLVALISVSLSPCVMAAGDRSELLRLFMEQLRACYVLPIGGKGEEPPIVEIRLNADGSLAQAPKVLRGNPDSVQAKAAVRTVNRCAPFRIPAEIVPRHAQWKVMTIRLDTN